MAVFSGDFITERFHCNPALLRRHLEKISEGWYNRISNTWPFQEEKQARRFRRTPSPLRDLSFKHQNHTIAHDAYFQESSRRSVSFLNTEHNYHIKALAKHVYRSPCIFIMLYCALEKTFLKWTKAAADWIRLEAWNRSYAVHLEIVLQHWI